MSLAIASIALYGAGVTSTISPCVLPLVPGYLGVLVDGSASRGARAQRVAVFAVGAIATFVTLGGVAAAVGLPLSARIGWIQRLAGFCLIVLGTPSFSGSTSARSRAHRCPCTTDAVG